MIFAAGIGSRLKPFTLSHPKALVPIDGIPMLQRVIMNLHRNFGVNHFVVNVHHFATQVIDFLHSEPFNGIDIKISDESDMLLDTGGGLRKALPLFDHQKPLLVHNADILCNVNIGRMLLQHLEGNSHVTLLATPRKTQRYLAFDKGSMLMKGWTNIATGQVKPETLDTETSTLLAFNGIHVLSPKFLEALKVCPEGKPFSLTDFYIKNCDIFKIRPYTPVQHNFMWFDVGKPETLERAENWVLETKI